MATCAADLPVNFAVRVVLNRSFTISSEAHDTVLSCVVLLFFLKEEPYQVISCVTIFINFNQRLT